LVTVKKPTNNFGTDPDLRNFYSYSDDVLDFLSYIANNYLLCAKDQSVLEIGPATGWFTHALQEVGVKDLTLVESFDPFFAELEHKFSKEPNLSLVKDDVFQFLMQKSTFDVVVALGVIYHFSDPIGFLERIVNQCNPKYIVLDSPDGVLAVVEEPGKPGDRQVSNGYISSNLTITVPVNVQKQAMYNLGYTLVKDEDLSRFNIQSKEETIIMLFEKVV
jgi:SAM-dependent methyltransferase